MRNRQRAFALPAAIFLITVLAMLGTYLVTVSSVHHTTTTMVIMEAEALQAARAGIEYGAHNVLVAGGCAGAPWSISPPGSSLAAFTVTVTCTAGAYDDTGSSGSTVYTLVSTACNQPAAGACPPGAPGEGYVERQVQATLGK